MSFFHEPETTDLTASIASQVVGRTLQRITSTGTSMVELTIYDECEATSSVTPILECVTNALEAGQHANAQDANTWFLIFVSALIFFMQAGFAMLCAGSVRVKNVGEYSHTQSEQSVVGAGPLLVTLHVYIIENDRGQPGLWKRDTGEDMRE
jgi:hypothetical protein